MIFHLNITRDCILVLEETAFVDMLQIIRMMESSR